HALLADPPNDLSDPARPWLPAGRLFDRSDDLEAVAASEVVPGGMKRDDLLRSEPSRARAYLRVERIEVLHRPPGTRPIFLRARRIQTGQRFTEALDCRFHRD